MEIGIPERKQGTIFVPIPIEITAYDAERLASQLISFKLFIKMIYKIIVFFLVELLQEGRTNIKRTVKPGMDLVNVKLALDDIYLMLNSVNEYVDKVIVSFNND